MSDKDKIFSLDLMYNDVPMPFVIKKLEGIDNIALGIETNRFFHFPPHQEALSLYRKKKL